MSSEIPNFEIVVDTDGGISEIYKDGEKLSTVLPSICEARVDIDCAEGLNKIEIICYGDTTIKYRK